MDSAWIASWLAYVNIARGVAPCPGSCNNKRLLVYDYEEQKYVKRPGLMMAVKEQAGDFRRVSEEVWLKFKEYYPESGPAVTMIFTEDDNSLEKCEWVVLDKLDPPNDTEKKKKKLNFAKFLSKKDKNKDAVGENEENVTHISNDHTTTNIAALLLESNREVVTTKDNNVAPDSTPKNNVKNESVRVQYLVVANILNFSFVVFRRCLFRKRKIKTKYVQQNYYTYTLIHKRKETCYW